MRLLSYNIHKAIGGRDRLYRLDRVIGVIEAENPDLICLQEVDRNVRRSNFDDQPSLLAAYFRPAAELYQFNVRVRDGGYGNLILARWPFRESHRISLRQGRRKNRGAQLTVLDTPEGPLQLINWHLGLAERERHWQVDHLLSHALFRALDAMPTLVVGDTNDWRNTLGHGPFARAGFIEATAPPSRHRSFPAYLPVASLDKAFYRGDFTIRHVRLPRTALAKQASDHLPLVVDFHLPGAIPPEVPVPRS